MDSVAYRLRPATIAQVVEQHSFQFIFADCATIFKIFSCPLATLQSKRHCLSQNVIQDVILFAKMCDVVLVLDKVGQKA